jgi:enoyl-CoA hydratase/carnithine racemase
MLAQGIQVETEGKVARVVMDRPPVNAVSTATYEALRDALAEINERSDMAVVLLCSALEDHFSAGADLPEVERIVASPTSELDEKRQLLARDVYDRLLNLAQPTIAVVNGTAMGAGAVLAACCDIRVGSRRARIALTEINVARCGGARHMSRLLPQGVVRRMYFTAEPLDAETAYRYGFLQELCDPGEELSVAEALAAVIAAKSPHALRLAKESLNACEGLPVADGYALEQQYTLKLGRTPDAREAVRAFLEKRDPVWSEL